MAEFRKKFGLNLFEKKIVKIKKSISRSNIDWVDRRHGYPAGPADSNYNREYLVPKYVLTEHGKAFFYGLIPATAALIGLVSYAFK